MKKTKRSPKRAILFSAIGIVVICTAVIVLTSLYISNPTKGAVITRYDNPKSALLVIDVQNDTTGNTALYSNTTGFVNNVNQAIIYAQETGMEILYVRNVTGKNPIIQLLSSGKYKDGTEGAEFDRNLQVVNENVFTKSIGDSFSSSGFDDYLRSKNVDTLYIVGADAAACIYSTARGGKNRQYIVNIIEDAIITINEKTRNDMLKKYENDGMKVIDLARFEELTNAQ